MQNNEQDSHVEVAGRDRGTTRRAVVAGAGVTVVAAALGGCGTYGEPSKDQGAQPAPAGTAAPQGTGAAPAAALAKTSEIPVGGGKIFTDKKVVVTQPTQGEFKAFSTVCTHQGCTVGKIEGGTIDCPCHGSKFAIADGSPTHGPARRPLPEAKITVSGDTITLA